MPRRETLHIKPADPAAGCDVHEWPTEGLARRLIDAMRSTHSTGGVNACLECIQRAKKSLPRLLPKGVA